MIDREKLLDLAKECKLSIPEENVESFLESINDIISFIDTIEMNQDPNILYEGSRLINVFRKDGIKASLARDDFLDGVYFECKVGEQ